MKRTVLFLATIPLFTFSCNDTNELILGKWKKVRSDRQGHEEWAFSPAILIFHQDNSFEAGKFTLDNSKHGKWEVNENGDSLILTEENRDEPESFRINKISQDSLVLTSSEYRSYFKRQ